MSAWFRLVYKVKLWLAAVASSRDSRKRRTSRPL